MFNPWRQVSYRRGVVHLHGGRTLIGLLDVRGRLLMLRDASVVEGANRLKIDGEAVVERAQIEWVQLLPNASGEG